MDHALLHGGIIFDPVKFLKEVMQVTAVLIHYKITWLNNTFGPEVWLDQKCIMSPNFSAGDFENWKKFCDIRKL